MNLLAPASGAISSADGAQAVPAVTVQAGSTSTAVMLAASDAAQFKAGSMIALDTDYAGQTGFVGSPVSGAYVRQPLTDVDYIRRVTFNVALVSQVTSSGLTLAAPLLGGVPPAGSKLQACNWICRPRRRVFLPGVVGSLRDARQPGRTHLLPLPATASHDGSGGSSDTARRKRKGRARSGCCSKASSGIARHGSAGWRARALLPKFPAGAERADLVPFPPAQIASHEFEIASQRESMKITIQGQDYTSALDAARPLTIERSLNEPSICSLWISLPTNSTLTMPLRNQSLTVTETTGQLTLPDILR